MSNRLFILCLSILSITTQAQKVFRTEIIDPNIKTLQVKVNEEKYLLPIIELNGSDVISVEFDEMSHELKAYSYKVLHCNADWTLSDLSTTEFVAGFTTATITDYNLSQLTTFLYTHYQFKLPNYDMNFKISGNYLVSIYEDNQTDKPVAQACFSIVEPKVKIDAKIRANTDIELNGRLQQVDFDIVLNGYRVKDVNQEFKVLVRQNNRFDNEVRNISPSSITDSKITYANNKALIFEGGNEYHRFDISSIYAASEGVAEIRYAQPHYEAYLIQNKVNASKNYQNDFDVNGKFLINFQESVDNSNYEADYLYVHFMLPMKQPFFDGQLYLGGELNYNLFNDNSRLQYDFNGGGYYKTMLLKQGGYNFQYWFVPKGTQKAITEKVDGSFWQTGNEYTIYIYHRSWGERYDRLIGVKSFN